MTTATTFDYQVVDAAGRRSKGKIDASNAAAAAHMLRMQGYAPLAIAEAGKGLQRDITIPGLSNRVGLRDLAVFARQFATMTTAGLSLLRALGVLAEQTSRVPLQNAIKEIRLDVESGMSLSAALARHDRIFPTLMTSLVRAGETGGFLDDALERIAHNLEKDTALRGKIKSALTYPAVVLIFSLVLITAVLLFIVPVFEKMFRQLGGALPTPTRIIVALSHTLAWSGPLLVVLAVAGGAALRWGLRVNPGLRLAVDRGKLRLPVFGSLARRIAISRFARNLSALLDAGVPIIQALDIVGATTGNAVIAQAATELQRHVRDGQPMSVALRAQASFPPMVTQMVEVGEESGQISTMLDKIADFYDREIDTATESLTAMVEPIMVLVMGAIVGATVVCLYLPMFTIYQHIQGAQ